jgi:hypothetical protein
MMSIENGQFNFSQSHFGGQGSQDPPGPFFTFSGIGLPQILLPNKPSKDLLYHLNAAKNLSVKSAKIIHSVALRPGSHEYGEFFDINFG